MASDLTNPTSTTVFQSQPSATRFTRDTLNDIYTHKLPFPRATQYGPYTVVPAHIHLRPIKSAREESENDVSISHNSVHILHAPFPCLTSTHTPTRSNP